MVSETCKVLSIVEYITGKEKVNAKYVMNKKEMQRKRDLYNLIESMFPMNFSDWDDALVAICDGTLAGFLTFVNLDLPKIIKFNWESLDSKKKSNIGYERLRILHDYAARRHPAAGYEIELMGVDDKWRKRGIAKEMMYKIFESCNGKKRCLYTLYVRKKNLAARNLYKKFGFEELYTIEGYYSHRERVRGLYGYSCELGEKVVEDDAIYMAVVV